MDILQIFARHGFDMDIHQLFARHALGLIGGRGVELLSLSLSKVLKYLFL